MEPTQIVLIVVVLVLTTVLTLVGIEVYFILREFRESVRKINNVLNYTVIISESVAQPVASLSSFLTGLKNGASLMKFVSRFTQEEEKKHA